MPPSDDDLPAPPPVTREELIAIVAQAHLASAYGASSLAGQALAAQSRLPKLVAMNLGAGFGQWDFFPEAAEIVDFALAYVPPSTQEEIHALARAWASDDAARRNTLMALVGREILQHELRRIDVPALRELVEESRPARALALRTGLGLPVPEALPAPTKASPRKPAPVAKATPAAPRAIDRPDAPSRMPKPVFVPPPKRGPEPPPRRFVHPTFGEGVLERQDGSGTECKLTIKFNGGSKTLLARFVTEVPV